MNRLTIPTLKMLLKKKETIITLLFSLYPLLLFIVDWFHTNFMQIGAPKNSLGFLEFFSGVESTQYQIALPLVAFIYLVCTIFHDEISSGVLFLYKDIDRTKILNAKLGALFIIYFIYFGLTLLSSLITYYFSIIKKPYASGKFLPQSNSDLQYVVLTIISIMLVTIIILSFASLLSIKFGNGVTIILGILMMLTASIAPQLKTVKYLFPNGYVNSAFNIAWIVMIVISLVYCSIMYIISDKIFKKLEF
ncbi:hypothetical protein [Bombilactobacillus thymidiniphilus]|uniref:Amino acid transporter n=1 Tax=Bombilactobacillus thymidiniphilus TaxID=2923363 RepID=A0ABY4PBF1_9LACO|nr:hypothetical protein [Bombilactobacillus thymidiniphilus]UQS83098.1 hypothetical protein MOO47_04745 [Bombilactobacillus thymidiniphilus]